MRWTTAASIAEQVLRRWNRGEILAARVTGETLFPMEIRLKRPSARQVADRFGEVQDWAQALATASRDSRGFGFALRLETLRNRVQGRNQLPVAATIATESDALRLIRRQAEAERFEALAEGTLARHPALRGWLARHPLIALAHAEHWERVLAVLDWFVAHPRPGLYLRQLDIPGVDTKFIEAHRRLLAELLDAVLPEQAVDREASGARRFNQRYGLRSDPPLVRFRLLDPALTICGLDDLSLPPEQFATLKVPVQRVFLTENRTNGLAFPDCPGSLVVFGLGYGLESLAQVTWLGDVEVHYWGDLDTHGFGILNRLRAILPDARSFLMDRETLDAHRALWGQEPADKRYSGEPTRLTRRERALFDDLRLDRLGERVRLEQERIGFGWLQQALEDCLAAGRD
ncbi:MAG: DUF2220 family protein [Deltaproteobacteria bacterium]|nr:DUF2220 family protein [Deltaproteobacteria bacterium]